MVLGRYRRSHPIVIVTALQTAFEADTCVRTTEPLGLVLNSFVPPLVAMNLALQPEYLEASNRARANERPFDPRLKLDLLTSATSLGNGFVPAAKSARWRFFNVRSLHSSFKLCQGHLRYSARSNRLWIRFRPPDHDSGMFPLTLRRHTSDSRLPRTRWPTIRIMSTLGKLAVTYVKHSTVN
jgi:hypothetical protein